MSSLFGNIFGLHTNVDKSNVKSKQAKEKVRCISKIMVLACKQVKTSRAQAQESELNLETLSNHYFKFLQYISHCTLQN